MQGKISAHLDYKVKNTVAVALAALETAKCTELQKRFVVVHWSPTRVES